MRRCLRCMILGCLMCSALNASDETAEVAPTTDPLAEIRVKEPILFVDVVQNTASGLIHLANPTSRALSFTLSASDFVSCSTLQGLGAGTLFSHTSDPDKPETGKEVLSLTLAPGAHAEVKIAATNLWEAGESRATLFADASKIATLKAVKFSVPFGVSLAVPTPDKPVLDFIEGQARDVTLKNSDPMTYVATMQLEVEGVAAKEQKITIPPGDSAFRVDPPAEWFDVRSWFRSQPADGTLTLRFSPPASVSAANLPSKRISFQAHLNGSRGFSQSLLSYGLVFLLAAAGGLCSLMLNNWIPNRLKREDLQERLDQLAERTREITRLDSGLRVFLRVERHRLRRILYSRLTIGSQFAEVAKLCETKITVLARQIDLAARIDGVLDRIHELSAARYIPTKLEQVKSDLLRGQHFLRRAEPAGTELDKVAALIDAADTCVDGIDLKNEELETAMRNRLTSLTAFFVRQPPEPAAIAALRARLPQVFGAVAGPGAIVPDQIGPSSYAAVDLKLSRLELVRQYLEFITPDLTNPNPQELERLAARLGADSAAALHDARDFLSQLKEGVSIQILIERIKASPPQLVAEPPPLEDRLSRYSALFPGSAQQNSATARGAISVKWDFDHLGLTENGWEVYHYFPRDRRRNEYTVRATYYHEGLAITDAAGDTVTSKLPIQVLSLNEDPNWFGGRNAAELVRLAIALFLALLGLLAGGQAELAKLDIIAAAVAVFLLGFSANSIKDLFAPKT